MAAQVDLIRAKVEKEMLGVSLRGLYKERKRKKRDVLPLADKSERRENDAKKAKLHHNQNAAEHRSLQPHQQKPKDQNFGAGKPVLLSQKHSRHQHHQSNLAPTLRPPEPQLLQRQKKRMVPPEAPALFTFTPLQTVKIRNQDFHGQHRDKTLNLGVKKENTVSNVKHAEVKKKKGGFCFLFLLLSKSSSYSHRIILASD